MPIKLLPHLRFLHPSLPVTRIPPLKSLSAFTESSFLPVPVLSLVFPTRVKHISFTSHLNSQFTFRRFSTRPFRNRSATVRSSSEFRQSKSLIEDEEELSAWVSGLNDNSNGRRKISGGEDDSDFEMGRNNRGKRRREGNLSDDFDDSNNRRRITDKGDLFSKNRDKGDSFSRSRDRGDSFSRSRDRGDSFSRNRDSGNVFSRGSHRGDSFSRRGRADSFSRPSRGNKQFDGGERFSSQRNGDRDKRSLKVERGEEENDDERNDLMGHIRDMVDDDDVTDSGDVDDEDDGVFREKAASALGFEKKKEKPSSAGESDSYLTESRFDQCPISPLSLKGIKEKGYEKMTAVQEATLPVILKGTDVLAKARTGTGKTVAFLLPAIEVVVKSPPSGRDQKRPPILVLVICPTRELACQAAAEANMLLKYHPSIGVQVVMGGTRLPLEQKQMQANPCQILVATPGRLKDHLENTAGFATRLMGVKVLVLDEADHLLDMGFRKDIERIIAAVPKQRQTLLFSATVPEEVRQICHIALKRDHEFINTVEEGSDETHSLVRQTHLAAPLDKHFPILYVLLKDHIADNVDYKVLVFCTTAMVTRMVANLLGELKLNVREIHSRKPQSYRTRVSDEFRKSKGLILVTSDVSARGVDYPDVTLVVQLGLPGNREQYIHRLGRTGRKGKEGLGVLILAPWEERFLSTIKDLPITKASEPSVDPDTKKKVERGLSHVEMKNKEAAYQAWLGYYNSSKLVGKDKYRLVELANEFSRSMGLDNPPAIPKLVLGKMGLRNIPGLRSK